eukprot:NODE_11460_length_1285_cov_5.303972.p1 GENE.NODE_11460_length_1285_cov_5.303972~~NODE_11460_length_1285_cov_5.303972.p1  ORF type:complete len:361 (+),score=117.47 NODE_11460_length_1285_cov_5.303972:77-1159(+)
MATTVCVSEASETLMTSEEQHRATQQRLTAVVHGPIADKVPKGLQPHVKKSAPLIARVIDFFITVYVYVFVVACVCACSIARIWKAVTGPFVEPRIEQLAPLLAKALSAFIALWPKVAKVFVFLFKHIERLPMDAIQGTLGFLMCFYGGMFPWTIAGIEAWRLCGGQEALKDLRVAMRVDIQADAPALNVIDPEQFNTALARLFLGWVGSIATLKVKFVRTITLGTALGEMVNKSCQDMITPLVKPHMSEEHQKLVPTILKWIVMGSVVTAAWCLQYVLTACHAAMRGGRILSKQVIQATNRQGDFVFNDKDLMLQEILSCGFAMAGLTYQLTVHGHVMPRLFRCFLFPIEILELHVFGN